MPGTTHRNTNLHQASKDRQRAPLSGFRSTTPKELSDMILRRCQKIEPEEVQTILGALQVARANLGQIAFTLNNRPDMSQRTMLLAMLEGQVIVDPKNVPLAEIFEWEQECS